MIGSTFWNISQRRLWHTSRPNRTRIHSSTQSTDAAIHYLAFDCCCLDLDRSFLSEWALLCIIGWLIPTLCTTSSPARTCMVCMIILCEDCQHALISWRRRERGVVVHVTLMSDFTMRPPLKGGETKTIRAIRSRRTAPKFASLEF